MFEDLSKRDIAAIASALIIVCVLSAWGSIFIIKKYVIGERDDPLARAYAPLAKTFLAPLRINPDTKPGWLRDRRKARAITFRTFMFGWLRGRLFHLRLSGCVTVCNYIPRQAAVAPGHTAADLTCTSLAYHAPDGRNVA
jgi:hypothetical protein